MNKEILKITNVSKKYRLGMIGGTTLRDELQRKRALRKGLEDPTQKIGTKQVGNIGEEFYALDNINLTIHEGERVGIIGHNGAGKSTLLKLISQITEPSTGTIEMNGRIASMLEVGTGFHPELSGRENIYMNGAILGMSKQEIDSKIEDIIEFSECRQFIDTPVKRYSSGMYVKLAFSVAAHLDSEIMIMDEVLAVGDMAFQKKCLDKMSQVSKTEGRTILYVSHNMNTIRQLCDRCIVLDHGKMIYDGEVDEAIDIYMNNSLSKEATYIDLTKIEHWGSQCTYDIEMKELEILDKESPDYSEIEKLVFNVKFEAKKPLHNVRFRMTLRDRNDASIGTSWSKDLCIDKKGTYVVRFVFNLNMLPKGTIYSNIGFYGINQGGNFLMYDHVNRAFRFTMYQEPKEGNIIWNPSYWGYVKLPEIEAEITK